MVHSAHHALENCYDHHGWESYRRRDSSCPGEGEGHSHRHLQRSQLHYQSHLKRYQLEVHGRRNCRGRHGSFRLAAGSGLPNHHQQRHADPPPGTDDLDILLAVDLHICLAVALQTILPADDLRTGLALDLRTRLADDLRIILADDLRTRLAHDLRTLPADSSCSPSRILRVLMAACPNALL